MLWDNCEYCDKPYPDKDHKDRGQCNCFGSRMVEWEELVKTSDTSTLLGSVIKTKPMLVLDMLDYTINLLDDSGRQDYVEFVAEILMDLERNKA